MISAINSDIIIGKSLFRQFDNSISIVFLGF